MVVVTVHDNGEGISDDIRDHLLEPFFTTRIDSGGSGLGLYIADFIITNHGGSLTFDSQPDTGTTFTVSIPAADS
jgi:signal transduction histidine kinase